MLNNIIRLFSIAFCSTYTFTKISNKSNYPPLSKLQLFYLLFLMQITSVVSNVVLKELTYLVPIVIFWLTVSYFTDQPQKSFIVVIISYAISVGMYFLSSFISTIMIYSLFPLKTSFPYVLLAIMSSILQNIGVYLLCKTKRLRNGMPFLSQYNLLNITTIICIFLFVILVYCTENHHTYTLRIIAFFSTVLVLAFLIYWWQAQITKSYRRSLELRELESLRTEIAEKDAVIQKLMKDNENLARISHRDNSLICALKDSTVKYLSTDYKSPAEAIAARDKLISNINTLSAGRNSLPHTYGERTPREFDTGLSLLDDLLHHMDKEALEQDIMFSVHFGTLLKDFVPENTSESDLTHTVDDLLKNAFKSTRTCESRAVQLQFYKLGKHLVIEVADNGIPFEVRSLVNMGIEQLTTYEDGSGIGLMDIWSTKENYRATYHIDEYATSSPFSKKISLTFDKKNRYTIRTYRKDEILQMSRRADLQVYDDLE